jgi:hypothetical protein
MLVKAQRETFCPDALFITNPISAPMIALLVLALAGPPVASRAPQDSSQAQALGVSSSLVLRRPPIWSKLVFPPGLFCQATSFD